jgi:hypothetical protein
MTQTRRAKLSPRPMNGERHVDLQRSGYAVSRNVGLANGFTGVFLWPAVALHAVLSMVFGRAVFTKDAMKR